MPLPLAPLSPQGSRAEGGTRPSATAAPLQQHGFAVPGQGQGRVKGSRIGLHPALPQPWERVMTGADAEIETFKREVSCAALLEQFPPPWKLDKRESTRHALKYRRGKGEVLIVNHDQRGWWDPQSTAKGDVCSLVQHLDRTLNFGQVRQVLRRFMGVSPSFPEVLRSAKAHADVAPAIRWAARPRLRPGSAGWKYLTIVRRLPAFILTRAISLDVVREGYRGSVWFAHRQDGDVQHVEVRGPTFKGSLRGGVKSLFRVCATKGGSPTRLAIAEAPIDALSLAAIEHLRSDTIYAATGGGMGDGTISAIEQLLKGLIGSANAELASAADANLAGERYATRHAELARSAAIRFVRLPPTVGTDWNDVLRERGV